tara:strand:+ start:277 stop:585 length:309 start_codon:yes stop_codon:yes gene_type:complete
MSSYGDNVYAKDVVASQKVKTKDVECATMKGSGDTIEANTLFDFKQNIRVNLSSTELDNPNFAGTIGDVVMTANYIYVCRVTGDNTTGRWVRAALQQTWGTA